MTLMDELRRLINDEFNAWQEYNRLADQADEAGMHVTARELRKIAADENRHRYILKRFVLGPDLGPIPIEELPEQPWMEPSRPSPQTYGDWVNLGVDIKEKVGIDDVEMTTLVNRHLNHIYEEEQDPSVAQESKRWLVEKAGELGIR